MQVEKIKIALPSYPNLQLFPWMGNGERWPFALKFQRRTHHCHSMGFPQVFQRAFLIFRNIFTQLAHLFKEVFHGPRGLKENEHLPFSFADLCKGMGNLSWREGGVSRLQR